MGLDPSEIVRFQDIKESELEQEIEEKVFIEERIHDPKKKKSG